jgi:hypothetical protein
MLRPTTFLVFWALTFVTLGAAFLALKIFYRLAGSELDLHTGRREFIYVVATSLGQAIAAWFCAPFMGLLGLMSIALVMAAIVYWVLHFPDWGGFEAMGLAIFEWILWLFISTMMSGDFGRAFFILVLFIVGLAVIIGFGRSL